MKCGLVVLLLALAAATVGAQTQECAAGRECTLAGVRTPPLALARFPACAASRTGQLRFDGDAGVYRVCAPDGGWSLLDTGSTAGTETPPTAPDYAAAGNVWQPYAVVDGFTKPAAACWRDANGYTVCAGAVQRTAFVGPAAGEVLFRLPGATMNPKSAGERAFRCASYAGDVTVHVTGTDFDAGVGSGFSGPGWARIYDWSGTPEKAISLDGIRFKP